MTVKPPLYPDDAVCAIIVLSDGRYLMQLRDDKPEIFFPDCWGLFGGGVEDGETDEQALLRELLEEIGLPQEQYTPAYFSRHDFDLSFSGCPSIRRVFYEVHLPHSDINQFELGEGRRIDSFSGDEILTWTNRIVPYDAFGLWMHIEQKRLRLK